MKVSIVNVSCGSWYPAGQDRLVRTLRGHGYNGEFNLWKDQLPYGAPSHQQSNYSFKTYAMDFARRQGHDIIVWADSSLYAVGDISPIIDIIANQGYFVLANPGWSLHQWCSDKALSIFGCSRNMFVNVPHCSSGIVGLNMRDPLGCRILKEWHEFSQIPGCFHGSHTNERGQVSSDPRVLGHRHDQTALNFLIWKMGLEMNPITKLVSINSKLNAQSDVVKSGEIRMIFQGM